MKRLVNVRRPWAYLSVGTCLTVVALLLPGPVRLPPPAPPPEQAPAAGPQIGDCDPVGSLRPQGTLPTPGDMPAGSTMAEIHARGRLIVAVDQSKLYSGFRNPLTGQLEGFDIDVATWIAEAIFGEAEDRVQFIVTDIADRAAVIETGRVDLVVNHFSITCPRQERVAFSTGYLEARQRVLVPEDAGVASIDDLSGQKVCGSVGSTNMDTLQRLPGGPVEVALPNVADCLVLLQQGRVAGISSDDVILAGLAGQDPRTLVVGPPFAQAWYGVGMNKDAEDLVRFVNAVLERRFADGTWAASYRRWYEGVLGPVPLPPPVDYRD